ncbi:MAG: ATP-binding protein [Rhodocyclaceae bacterium]|nr:ATP-binding protein [Rhodocyclaceae bacterium]
MTTQPLRRPARTQSPAEAHQETALPIIYLCGKQGIGKTAIANTLAQLLGCVKVIDGNSSDDEESQRVTPGTLVEGGYVEHICNRAPGSIAIDVQDDAAIENLITLLQRVAGNTAHSVNAQHLNQAPSATLLQEIAELHLLTRPGARFAPPESASFLRSGPASRSDQSGEIKPAPLAASPEAAAPNPSGQQSDQSSAQNSAQSPLPETPFPQEPVHCSLP